MDEPIARAQSTLESLASLAPPERRRVGMVFQQGALFPHLDALSNVLYGLKGRPDRAAVARAALDQVRTS